MDFFGVSLARATRDELAAACRAALADGTLSPLAVATPNPEILLKAAVDPSYAADLSACGLRIPDGMGLYLAAQLLDLGWPRWAFPAAYLWSGLRLFWGRRALYARYGHRMAGSDLTALMLAEASAKGLSVAVVEPLVAEIRTPGDARKKANQALIVPRLRAKYPGLGKLDVFYHDKTSPESVPAALAADPRALVVCTLGAPAQERAVLAIARAAPGCRLLLAVGGSLDFECGFVRRAPAAVRKLGLEWLWRLALEPRKRARRIWDAVVRFPMTVARRAG